MMDHYDRAGRPVTLDEAQELIADCGVRRTVISAGATLLHADVVVSTIHLVLDHRVGTGLPLIFETMVLGGPLDYDGDRWSTEAEAVAGHEVWVRRARDAVQPHPLPSVTLTDEGDQS